MVRLLLIIVLVLAVLVLVVFVLGYNKIRGADIRVAEALSGIDVELTRRASLIPSLVHTVQTFASHEKGILDHVTNARAALTSATSGKSVAERSAAEQELDSALAPVLALGQSYPQLNSSNNFLNLQDNLADTENKLAFARQYYNDAVATLNRLISTIPWMFVAPLSRCVRTRVLPDSAVGMRDRLRRYPRARPAVPAPARRLAAPRGDRACSRVRTPPPVGEASRRRRPSRSSRSSAVSPCCGRKDPTPTNSSSELAELAPEACAVVAYGALLRDDLLAVPAHGWINLHFSLLPAWRGAAPVQAAIAAGDTVTGATTFQIEPALDSGPVYGVVTETIRPTDTAGNLLDRLSISGAALLETTLDGIADGSLSAVPQPSDGVTVAPKVTVDDARVRWDLPAHVVERRIRAVTPNPGAWTLVGELRVKLGPVTVDEAAPNPLPPGAIRVDRTGVRVGTASQPVLLGSIQPPGKKQMDAAAWARGARLDESATAS